MCEKTKKKKNEEKTETLAACILEMVWAISFKFGMWTPLVGGQLCSKIGYNRIRDHQDTKVWKWRFLPVNIPTVWRANFLGHTTLYRVSWFTHNTELKLEEYTSESLKVGSLLSLMGIYFQRTTRRGDLFSNNLFKISENKNPLKSTNYTVSWLLLLFVFGSISLTWMYKNSLQMSVV